MAVRHLQNSYLVRFVFVSGHVGAVVHVSTRLLVSVVHHNNNRQNPQAGVSLDGTASNVADQSIAVVQSERPQDRRVQVLGEGVRHSCVVSTDIS